MPRQRSVRRELAAAALSTFVALVGAIDLVGHPARTVHVLTIFVGGLAAGLALGRGLQRRRDDREVGSAPKTSA
jgi:hypothetical protein